ncbi:hypothetical protein BKI52_18700 [marine bacterium AO1-C]|nr:hypothetical protein BKI52_18700 [marine bacterium AO1-C]
MYRIVNYLFVGLLINVVFHCQGHSQNPSTETLRKTYQTKLNNLSYRLQKEVKQSEQKIAIQQRYLDSLAIILDILEQDREHLKNLVSFNQQKKNIYKLKIMAYNEFLLRKDSFIKEIKKSINNKKPSIVIQTPTLKVEYIVVNSINQLDQEKTGSSYRERTVKKLKARFSLADNKAAKTGKKNLIVLFIDNKRQIFYAATQNFIFDNSQQNFVFTYTKEKLLDRGQYSLEVHCDGKKIGSTTFSIR